MGVSINLFKMPSEFETLESFENHYFSYDVDDLLFTLDGMYCYFVVSDLLDVEKSDDFFIVTSSKVDISTENKFKIITLERFSNAKNIYFADNSFETLNKEHDVPKEKYNIVVQEVNDFFNFVEQIFKSEKTLIMTID